MPSTAAAARAAAEDAEVAAIGSAIAADVYGLATVEASIEDRRDNTTRFFVIGTEMSATPSEHDKTALLFSAKHKPGSLRIGSYFYGVQPVTDADEFCGEFREK